MQSEIVNYLRLREVSENKFIFVSKDVSSDSNFIYSEIISYYIKNDYAVILLNFVQSFAHYNHLFLKCGVNIRQLRDSQDFVIIDGLSEVEKLTNLTSESGQNAEFSTLFSDSLGPECVKQLFFCINSHIEKFVEKSKNFVLFLDDISVLLHLGLDLKAIHILVQYCRSVCFACQTVPNVLLIGSTRESKDEESVKMVNYLLHLADIRIQIEGLRTGYSKDAHGKIAFSKRCGNEGISYQEKMLFKISEKGAKLLTLGL